MAHLEIRGQDGELLRSAVTDAPAGAAYFGWPDLVQHDGRYNVAFSTGGDGPTPNQVWVQSFGCVD